MISRIPTLSLAATGLIVLSCGIFGSPISEAADLASTVEALATSLPEGIPDVGELPDIPGLPDVTSFLKPTGEPASEWRGVPIMPEAVAGQEFSGSAYSYRVPTRTGLDVEAFYDASLEELGWISPARTNVGTAGGFMLFSKDGSALNIMITKSEGDIVVILIMP